MSKTSSPNTTDNHHFQAYLSQGAREGGLILTVAMCIFLVMALVSHSPQDPGWASTGSNATASNYGGRAGAWFADVLLYFFGYVSYLFPILIGYRAAILFKNRRQRKAFHWPMFTIRVVGLIMTVLGATGLLALYSISGLDDVSGGVIGSELADKMDQALNLSGSTLLLVSMLLIGLTIFTGISWLGLMDRTGAITIALYEKLYKFSLNIWDNYQDKRQLKLENREVLLQADKQRVVINSVPDHSEKQKALTAPTEKEGGFSAIKSIAAKVSNVKKKLVVSTEEKKELVKEEPKIGAPVQVKANKKQTVNEEKAEADIKISPFVKKNKTSKRLEEEKQGNLLIASEGP